MEYTTSPHVFQSLIGQFISNVNTSTSPKVTDVVEVESIIRLVIFMDDDLADVVTLDPERKVNVQVGVAEDDFEMLNAAFEKSEANNTNYWLEANIKTCHLFFIP